MAVAELYDVVPGRFVTLQSGYILEQQFVCCIQALNVVRAKVPDLTTVDCSGGDLS